MSQRTRRRRCGDKGSGREQGIEDSAERGNAGDREEMKMFIIEVMHRNVDAATYLRVNRN